MIWHGGGQGLCRLCVRTRGQSHVHNSLLHSLTLAELHCLCVQAGHTPPSGFWQGQAPKTYTGRAGQQGAERAPAAVDKLAARRAREAAAEEAERKRKEAAAAKLRALEERIAARAAERCAHPRA